MTDWNGRNTAFSYDNAGRRMGLNLPNGTKTSYSYDQASRLTDLTHKTGGSILDSFSYTYDSIGNRLSVARPEEKINYTYDLLDRLIEATPTKLQGKDKTMEHKAEEFSYDPVGNRISGPESKDTYSYNQGNQLVSDRKNQYEYDSNGNLVKKTELDNDGETKIWTYSYDSENRLIKVGKQESGETKTITFKYDPFGRRIEKKVDGIENGIIETTTYTYVYDNEDIIAEYRTKTGKTDTTRYLHGPGIDEPLEIEKKGETYYYHADSLGSITALTDSRQKAMESYAYTSFGDLKRQGDKVKNTYTFTGREWDEETELYFYRARYYEPETGRFVTKDPSLTLSGNIKIPYLLDLSISAPSQLHAYIYSIDNPINLTDPQGLFIIDPFSVICAYNEYQKGLNISKNPLYKHCVISCNMAKKCGVNIALLAGFGKEILDLLDLDPKTHSEFIDIIADLRGINCCNSSLGCEKCCECEKGYKP